MRGILEFNLPEESQEFEIATKGHAYKDVLWDLDQWLRGLVKYGDISPEKARVYDEVRGKLRDLLNEENLEL